MGYVWCCLVVLQALYNLRLSHANRMLREDAENLDRIVMRHLAQHNRQIAANASRSVLHLLDGRNRLN